jgi:MtN3 and saliva related transmembrane protein
MTISTIGMLAAILTTGAYIPQAYKTIKTRQTRDLSMVTFTMLFAGTILWFIYGMYIRDTPLMLANE